MKSFINGGRIEQESRMLGYSKHGLKKKKNLRSHAQRLPGTAQSYAGLVHSERSSAGEERGPGGAHLLPQVAWPSIMHLLQNKDISVILRTAFFS